MSKCLPVVYEYDIACPATPMGHSGDPMSCCVGPSGDCSDACHEDTLSPEAEEGLWPPCPDGFEIVWCDRLEQMTALYPAEFSCITAEQLENMWAEVQCIIGTGTCFCRGPMELALLRHMVFMSVQYMAAFSTAIAAGALKGLGGLKPQFSLSSGLGGASNLNDAYFMLSPEGMKYIALRSTRGRNITGAYVAVAKRPNKFNLVGVY